MSIEAVRMQMDSPEMSSLRRVSEYAAGDGLGIVGFWHFGGVMLVLLSMQGKLYCLQSHRWVLIHHGLVPSYPRLDVVLSHVGIRSIETRGDSNPGVCLIASAVLGLSA